MSLGKNIARLRRERELTQEQLGKLLNISGQAVSKWENGGTPDAEMLPLIADTLGVSIDELFGRESGDRVDMIELLQRWLKAFPMHERMNELFRLLCSTVQRPYFLEGDAVDALMQTLRPLPTKTCLTGGDSGDPEMQLWLRAGIVLEEGLQLAVPAEDCPIFLLMPEPEDGYENNFDENDSYRRLFMALSFPGAIEILRALYGRKNNFRSASAIAKAAGIDTATAEKALAALIECGAIKTAEVELEEDSVEAYTLKQNYAFVPFMLFARWMRDTMDAYIFHWDCRKRPILQKKEDENK